MVNEVLNEDFNNPRALFIGAYCLLKAERFGMAYNLFSRVTQLEPKRSEPWNNMGMCHQETWNLDDAERCFLKSLALEKDNKAALNNLALVYVNRCQPRKALEWSEKALKIDSSMNDALDNKALACLMLRQWKEGWDCWKASLGGSHRREIVYGKETRWDGSKDKTVVVYGEQGLGDEIVFSSIIPDLIRDSKKVILDCDRRLEGIFKRSFPEADVYGTRFQKEVTWPAKYQIDHRSSVADLTRFYRNTDESFPGKPWLKPDPERCIQWKALLDSLGEGKKVGISFTGGLLSTGYKKRSVTLEAMLPILKQKAHFVSLQYKEVPDYAEFERMYGVKVHHWKRAVQSDDYDDTAALVSQLDLVITVTTAVVHLSGALGVPCWVLTPSKPRWFYCLEGDSMPWYSSVRLFRQKGLNWNEVINQAAGELQNRLR